MAEPAAATTGHGGMLAIWAGLALLHLAFAGRIGWADVVVAILSGGAAALLVRWVDRASGCHFHHHPDWVLLAQRIVRHIARDCAVVGRALLLALRRRHSIRGGFHELPQTPPDDPCKAASLRAFIAIGISTAPNSYIVDIGRGPEGRVIMHYLVPPEATGAAGHDEIWLP